MGCASAALRWEESTSRATASREAEDAGRLSRALVKPGKPVVEQSEPRLIDGVDPRPPTLLVLQESGVLQHAQVAGGGGPRVREAGRDVTRRHFPAKVDGQEDVPARRVRQGGEDSLQRLQACLGM